MNKSHNYKELASVLQKNIMVYTLFILLGITCITLFRGEFDAVYAQEKNVVLQDCRITGKVVDSKTAEPLIGVNVVLKGTTLGAATDIEGNFRILNVPAGEYAIVASLMGYAQMEIAAVTIAPGGIKKLDFMLKEKILEGEEIVVEAKALENTEASMLRMRQYSTKVSDAVSAEQMIKTGSSDAAEAVGRIVGATVLDGKYVYVRGLGDRYSTTQLNGTELPSPDPNKKAVHMDLFPANLLDNIVTSKTFTPDRPGNFAGGSVDINTKKFPDFFQFSFSSVTSYNSQTSLQSGFQSIPGNNANWLGMVDGEYEIPKSLQNPSFKIPDIGSAYRNQEKALQLDRVSKEFSPYMAPRSHSAPLNQNYNFSLGNQLPLFGRPLGVLGSVSYNRNMSVYKNGTSARWELTGPVSDINELYNDFYLTDHQSTEEVLWGGLVNLHYKLNPNHILTFNYMYNRNGESQARYMSGQYPLQLTGNSIYETRTLHFTERQLNSFHLQGQHYFKKMHSLELEWSSSFARSFQKEPDLRFFTDNYTILNNNGAPDTSYSIRESLYPEPTRYFRDLNENNNNHSVQLSLPFKQWSGLSGRVKFGGAYLGGDRSFRERRFEFRRDNIGYNGDASDFYNPANVGIISSSNGLYRFGNYVVDASELRGNYDGDQQISAGFGMVELPVTNRWRFVGGVRYETTRMSVISHDTKLEKGGVHENDVLPSANLIRQLGKDMNLRFAYGRTLARPTFRELAPYASYEFMGDYIFLGNAKLKRTLIDNYDVRWEWFERPGEIYAVSGFYKRLKNPIERVIKNSNFEVQFQNVDAATVYGAEFEARKQLGGIHPILENIQVGGNLALVNSRVDISPYELRNIRAVDPNTKNYRPLQGQSPYVVNLIAAYDNFKSGTSFTLYYNIFGERLSEISFGGTPDIFEQPRGILNLTLSQKLLWKLGLKVSGKNLLNSPVEKLHHYKGADYIYQKFAFGRIFNIGVSYSND